LLNYSSQLALYGIFDSRQTRFVRIVQNHQIYTHSRLLIGVSLLDPADIADLLPYNGKGARIVQSMSLKPRKRIRRTFLPHRVSKLIILKAVEYLFHFDPA
jgi:hypothetical protein